MLKGYKIIDIDLIHSLIGGNSQIQMAHHIFHEKISYNSL